MTSPHQQHEGDVRRDAVALLRCAVAEDPDGARAITGGTRCVQCLALAVARISVTLAAHFIPKDLFSDAQAKKIIDACLAGMQEADSVDGMAIDPSSLDLG